MVILNTSKTSKNSKEVLFDLDGVIRNLAADFLPNGGYPKKWVSILPDGTKFEDYLTKNVEVFLTSPTTEYYSAIFNYTSLNPSIILTSQKELWQENTTKWIYNNFPKENIKDIIFTDGFKEKIRILKDKLRQNPNTFLVEDYPKYQELLENIILIDRPYNENSNQYIHRIKTPSQLEKFLYIN